MTLQSLYDAQGKDPVSPSPPGEARDGYYRCDRLALFSLEARACDRPRSALRPAANRFLPCLTLRQPRAIPKLSSWCVPRALHDAVGTRRASFRGFHHWYRRLVPLGFRGHCRLGDHPLCLALRRPFFPLRPMISSSSPPRETGGLIGGQVPLSNPLSLPSLLTRELRRYSPDVHKHRLQYVP